MVDELIILLFKVIIIFNFQKLQHLYSSFPQQKYLFQYDFVSFVILTFGLKNE